VLNVVSWLWSQPGGRVQYKPEHVWLWADMVSRNLAMKHKLLCVTSETDLPPSVERIDPPGEFEDIQPTWGPRKPNCFRRLIMFKRDAAKTFGRRFVSMDLDCIVGGALDPLFNRRSEDFVIYRGTHPSRPYNGSLMLLRAGSRPQLYETFNQAGADASGAAFHGSDQAWIAHCLGPNEATWDRSDGVWHLHEYLPQARKANPTILFFPGKRKPWELHRVFPWMREHYRIVKEKEAA
jgi:hypothetical protein